MGGWCSVDLGKIWIMGGLWSVDLGKIWIMGGGWSVEDWWHCQSLGLTLRKWFRLKNVLESLYKIFKILPRFFTLNLSVQLALFIFFYIQNMFHSKWRWYVSKKAYCRGHGMNVFCQKLFPAFSILCSSGSLISVTLLGASVEYTDGNKCKLIRALL